MRLRTTLLLQTRFQLVNSAQASALTTLQGGQVRKDCVKSPLAGGNYGVCGVQGQQRCVGLGALQCGDADVPACKLRCNEGRPS